MEVSSLRLAGMFTTVNDIIVSFLCLLHLQDFSMLAGLCFDDRMLVHRSSEIFGSQLSGVNSSYWLCGIVNLTESRNTSGTGLQPHPLGIILIVLIEVGRTAHCG